MKKLERLLRENRTRKILDIGTGVGNFIFLLTQVVKDYDQIIGLDTSKRSIEIATSYFTDQPKIKFMEKNGEHTDFPDDYFDLVCLSNSLHHLGEPQTIFMEMERVLKPNGIILVHEMISEPLTSQQQSHKIIHHFSAEIDRYLGAIHDETLTKKQIEEKLNEYSSCELEESWIPEHPDKHQFSAEEIEHIVNSVDQMVSRIKDQEKIQYFKDKAEIIKVYIQENGFDLATEYMFALRNQN